MAFSTRLFAISGTLNAGAKSSVVTLVDIPSGSGILREIRLYPHSSIEVLGLRITVDGEVVTLRNNQAFDSNTLNAYPPVTAVNDQNITWNTSDLKMISLGIDFATSLKVEMVFKNVHSNNSYSYYAVAVVLVEDPAVVVTGAPRNRIYEKDHVKDGTPVPLQVVSISGKPGILRWVTKDGTLEFNLVIDGNTYDSTNYFVSGSTVSTTGISRTSNYDFPFADSLTIEVPSPPSSYHICALVTTFE